jgi:hypothetical protein
LAAIQSTSPLSVSAEPFVAKWYLEGAKQQAHHILTLDLSLKNVWHLVLYAYLAVNAQG